jgi:G protein beta subunit-like protein
MPAPTLKPASARPSDMSVVLVTGSYDHEIRFWEAWSGICSRTIARSGESGVRFSKLLSRLSSLFGIASESSSNIPRVSIAAFTLSVAFLIIQFTSKRLLAAAIHKKVNIYDIASASSTPVIIPPRSSRHRRVTEQL